MRTGRISRSRLWFWLSLAASFAAGAALRLYRLGAQPLLGDELHAVRGVVSTPLPDILVTYRITDYCLPLAGLSRFVLDQGATLSELDFRWPVVLSGLVLLAAAPLAVRPVSSRRAALLFPWLLALSPGLVLYSRIARSYAPAGLLALVAAAAFFAWFRTGRRRYVPAYAVLGASAVWFSLVVAPVVAAPLVFGILVRTRIFRRAATRYAGSPSVTVRSASPGWLGLAIAGLALSAGIACFVVPGWDSLLEVLSAKPGQGELRASAVLAAALLLAGSTSPAVAGLFGLLAAAGLAALARRDLTLALFTAVLVAGQCVAVVVATPYGLANPVILERYLLVTLPVILWWVAHGFDVLVRRRWPARSPRLGHGIAGAALLFVALQLATGPFSHPRFRYSSFVHHEDFLAFHVPLPRLPPRGMPAFYEGLLPAPGVQAREEAIVEFPSYPEGTERALHLYQDWHRRQVRLSTPLPSLNDRHLSFSNRVVPRPDDLLESGARFLVVHRDLEAEELAVELPEGVPRVWSVRQRNLSARFRQVAANLVERLTALWGPPHWDDAHLVAWDLDRVRSASAELDQVSRKGSEPMPIMTQ